MVPTPKKETKPKPAYLGVDKLRTKFYKNIRNVFTDLIFLFTCFNGAFRKTRAVQNDFEMCYDNRKASGISDNILQKLTFFVEFRFNHGFSFNHLTTRIWLLRSLTFLVISFSTSKVSRSRTSTPSRSSCYTCKTWFKIVTTVWTATVSQYQSHPVSLEILILT